MRPIDLTAVLDSLADGLLVFDEDGNICFINRAARGMLGLRDRHILETLTSDELMGRMAERFADFESARAIFQSGPGDGVKSVELRLASTDRALQVELRRVETGGQGALNLLVLRDTSARQQADLAQGERFRVLAHDMKTPLTSVKAYAQFAAMRMRRLARSSSRDEADGTLIEQALGYLETVNEQADRLTGMIASALEGAEEAGAGSGKQKTDGESR